MIARRLPASAKTGSFQLPTLYRTVHFHLHPAFKLSPNPTLQDRSSKLGPYLVRAAVHRPTATCSICDSGRLVDMANQGIERDMMLTVYEGRHVWLVLPSRCYCVSLLGLPLSSCCYLCSCLWLQARSYEHSRMLMPRLRLWHLVLL